MTGIAPSSPVSASTFDPTEYIYSGTTGQFLQTKYTAGANEDTAGYVYDANGQLTEIGTGLTVEATSSSLSIARRPWASHVIPMGHGDHGAAKATGTSLLLFCPFGNLMRRICGAGVQPAATDERSRADTVSLHQMAGKMPAPQGQAEPCSLAIP